MKEQHPPATVERIMVVDDEVGIGALLARILSDAGFHVTTVQSGEEAIDHATQTSFRAILLDLLMPGLDGIATLRELRKRGRREPVIVLTGMGTLQTAREAMLLGAYDYITKPFNTKYLLSSIRCAIAAHEESPPRA